MFDSWFGKRAHDYREFNKIPHDLGTAVNIVTMVFGNMGADSGTGVAFTRDPNTGEKALFGEYLTNAQGEDVVAGSAHAGQDQPDARRAAGGVRGVRGDRRAAGDALPRRPGPGVHHRARQAVHAPDALRQAHRPGRGEDRGRHGQRGDPVPPGGGAAGRPEPDRAAAAAALRRGGQGQGRRPLPGQGPQRLARRRHRQGDLRPGSGGGGQGRRRPGDPGADRDQPRRRARHAGRARRAHRPRRRHQPRGGGGALHGPALRGRRRDAADRLRQARA